MVKMATRVTAVSFSPAQTVSEVWSDIMRPCYVIAHARILSCKVFCLAKLLQLCASVIIQSIRASFNNSPSSPKWAEIILVKLVKISELYFGRQWYCFASCAQLYADVTRKLIMSSIRVCRADCSAVRQWSRRHDPELTAGHCVGRLPIGKHLHAGDSSRLGGLRPLLRTPSLPTPQPPTPRSSWVLYMRHRRNICGPISKATAVHWWRASDTSALANCY